MSLIKFISKGKKNILLIEFFLLLSIFLLVSFSYINYLKVYRENLCTLFTSTNESDLEISIVQPFSLYVEKRAKILEELNILHYFSLSSLPSLLFQMRIENESVTLFNFYVLNSDVFKELNISLSNNQALITSTQPNNLSKQNINVMFNFETTCSNLSIIDIVDQQTLIYTIFGENSTVLDSPEDISVIVTDDFLSRLLSSTNQSVLFNMVANNLVYSYYEFQWNKEEYMNLLPSLLEHELKQWEQERISIFLNIYVSNYFLFENVSITISQFFSEKLNDLSFHTNKLLYSTSIILMLLILVILLTFYLFIKSKQESIIKIVKLFYQRGVKLQDVRNRIFLIQLNLLIFILSISLGSSFLFLHYFNLIKWSYSISFILIVNGGLLLLIFISQIWFTQFISPKKFEFEETHKIRKKSRSKTLILLIQLGTSLIFAISIASILLLSQQYLNVFSISMTSVILIVFSLLGIFLLLLSLSFILQKTVFPSVLGFSKQSSKTFRFLKKLFANLNKSKKQIWLLIFTLQLIFSLVIYGSRSYAIHQEQLNSSYSCYAVSIKVDASNLPLLKTLSNSTISSTAFVEPIYTTSSLPNVYYIYLDNPISFYKGVNFFGHSFQKKENIEVFNALNASAQYVITTRQEVKQMKYKLNDILNLNKIDINGSIVTETKQLLDVARYFPFFSFLNFLNPYRLYLMKYDASNHIPNVDNYVIYSFQIQDKEKLNAFYANLIKNDVVFEIIHDLTCENNSTRSSSNISILFESNELKYFLFGFIPFIFIVLFIDFQREGFYFFSFLNSRGLRDSLSRFSLFLWFLLQFCYVTILSFVYSIILVLELIFILNQFQVLPIKVTFSWELLFLFVLMITFTTIFYLSPNVKRMWEEKSKLKRRVIND
ncbi:MAG: hypothetical protein ACTSUR_00615 [Candidatus Heimdallarchaeaceae archaeon]